MRLRQFLTEHAVVGIEVDGGNVIAFGRPPRRFRGRQSLARGQEIGARLEGGLQRAFERDDLVQRRIRNAIGQRERLSDRQADRARQLQFRLLELVFDPNRSLTLVLQLHLGAQHVNAGDQTGLFHVVRLPVERVGRILLRLCGFDAAGARDGFEVEVDRDQRYQVSRRPYAELLRPFVGRCRLGVVDGTEIEERLRGVDARVVDVERSDDRGVGLEAIRLEVDDLAAGDQPGRHIRQQFGERAPPRTVSILDRLFLKQQSKVELERPLYCILD